MSWHHKKHATRVKRLRTSIVLALLALTWDDLYLDSGRATQRCTVFNTGP
jgi:hypothetical protein